MNRGVHILFGCKPTRSCGGTMGQNHRALWGLKGRQICDGMQVNTTVRLGLTHTKCVGMHMLKKPGLSVAENEGGLCCAAQNLVETELVRGFCMCAYA